MTVPDHPTAQPHKPTFDEGTSAAINERDLDLNDNTFDPHKAEPTMEDRIDHMHELRTETRRLEKVVKELKAAYKAEEERVITLAEGQGLTTFGTGAATATISKEDMPTADREHWDDIFKFLIEEGYGEVIRKQLNAGPWRELMALGIEIPFVTKFEITKLSLRSRKS